MFPPGGSSRVSFAWPMFEPSVRRHQQNPRASVETWPLFGQKGIQWQIGETEKKLRTAASKSGVAAELEWLPAAIVYVPEDAPVLHRNDIGVTAAMSAEARRARAGGHRREPGDRAVDQSHSRPSC